MNINNYIYIIIEMILFALISVILRISVSDISVFQITFLRYGISFLFLLPIAFKFSVPVKVVEMKRHAYRSFLIYISALSWTHAIHSLDIGLAQALFYTKTILLGTFSGRLGSAAPSRIEWICISTGVVGVFLAVSPSLNSVPAFGAAAALLSALAACMITTEAKHIGTFQSPIGATLTTSAFTCAFALPLAITSWRPLNFDEVALVSALGLLTAASQALLFRIFSGLSLPKIAIVDLGRIIIATQVGIIFFDSAITAVSIAGILVISLSICSAFHFSK